MSGVTRRLYGLVLCAVLAIVSMACEGNQSMFNPQGPAARSIAGHGWFMIGLCLVVYVLVLAALAWAFGRRRSPADDSAETTRTLTRTVTAAVALTAAVLVALTVSSAAVGRGLMKPMDPGALMVDVVGYQWWWDFQYRGAQPSDFVTSPNELHMPVGARAVLRVQSRDVIHSFWVPNLHGKRDLIPGETTTMWIQADAPGVYRGQCAEFCGHQHAKMAFVVVAEPMEVFQAWIENQRKPAVEPATDELRRGRELFLKSTCATCHAIRGTDAGSRIGPDLTHVASRQTIASGALPNTHEHLRQWVANPSSVKPGTRMPPNPLSQEELEAVLSYLRALR